MCECPHDHRVARRVLRGVRVGGQVDGRVVVDQSRGRFLILSFGSGSLAQDKAIGQVNHALHPPQPY
jgi:hypothetical protein